MEARAHRPIVISILAIIGFIQGTFAIFAGLGLIFGRNDDLRGYVTESSNEILWYGILVLIVGIITFLVALGLWQGNELARSVFAVVQFLYIGGGIYWMFAYGGHFFWSGLFQILWALFILWLIYGVRSDDFFRGRSSTV